MPIVKSYSRLIFANMGSISVLLVRGALSDIATLNCVARMHWMSPQLEYVEVPLRGYAPLLTQLDAL